MATSHYDVIIIGGRPAGASLALRLAKGDLNVLVVDRATFPSRPAVPSMPIVLPHTIKMLEEIGIPESAIAASGAKLVRLQLEMNGHFAAQIDFAKAMEGDDRAPYFYSVKRDLLDNAIWEHLHHDNRITAKQDFGVSKLLKSEHGKVQGIEGANGQQFTADVVIGADGRYSFVGSQMNAEAFNEVSDHNTDFYFAYWQGGTYDHPDAMRTMHIYSTLKGYQYLIFPVGDGQVAVSIQMVKDSIPKDNAQSIDDYYLEQLQKYPTLWNQIKDAEKISPVYGMKNIRNGYREVGGAGWALVGDAAHFKDSIDGQGIYDALLGSKILAPYILKWEAGKLTWDQAMSAYREELLAKTYPMFLETQERLKREVYDQPPEFVVKNVLRRVMEDPTYQKQFVGYATRRFDPTGWASPQLMLGSLLRGFARDISKKFAS